VEGGCGCVGVWGSRRGMDVHHNHKNKMRGPLSLSTLTAIFANLYHFIIVVVDATATATVVLYLCLVTSHQVAVVVIVIVIATGRCRRREDLGDCPHPVLRYR